MISELQLHDALREQRYEGGRLGEILFARGWVSAVDLRDALAEQHGLDLRVEARAEAGRVVSDEGTRGGYPLGWLLVNRGRITEVQLDAALAEQARTGQRLGRILITNGAISTFTLAAALAEQQGLLTRAHEGHEPAEPDSSPASRWYEVRELKDGESHRLYASRNFVDATDLAFAVLYEWEPKELHVVCLLPEGNDEELCWQYPLD